MLQNKEGLSKKPGEKQRENGGEHILLKTILKRALQSIPTLLVVITFTFILTRMIPGNPALTMLGPQAPKESVEKLEEELGLNKSKGEQYLIYLKQIAKGDFGRSYSYNQTVVELIKERIPNTLVITMTSLLIALVLGMIVGIVSAVKQCSILDYVFMILALVGVSMPIFWLGLMLIIGFSLHLKWFPSGGDAGWRSLVLPVITLGTGCMASITRITRSSMLEVVRQDYIRTAKAKGVSSRVVIYKHALKNALIPVVTVVGLQFGSLLGGAVLTESVFSWPGVGTYLVNSIKAKDTPAVLGCVIIFCICFSIVNLVVDILYAYIDPRIKSKEQ